MIRQFILVGLLLALLGAATIVYRNLGLAAK